MKKNYRILALVLALVLSLSMLSACGSGSSSTAAASSGDTETAASAGETVTAEEATAAASTADVPDDTDSAEPVASDAAWPENALGNVDLPLTDDPVTVSIWMGVNPNVLKITEDIGNDCALWSELADRTGVNLEFTVVNPDTESEKFNLMVASNDLKDIISNATTLYTNGGEAAVADEIVIDTLPYLTEELTPQICKLMEAYPDAIPNALTESGWLAGMPQLSMQTDATQTFGPLIRQDWLDDLGLSTPETYDELHDVLTAFKEQKGADAALVLNYAGTGINNGLVQGYGINGLVADAAMSEPFYQVDDQVLYGPIQPEFKEYLTMVHEWYQEGLIWQDFMSYSDFQNPPSDVILADRTGVFYGEVTFIATLGSASNTEGFDLEAVPDFVQEAGGTIPFQDESSYTASTPWSISTQCECPELLMQWCNYMYTDEGALLCNYGIENESFVFDENGTPVFTDLVLNNPDMSTTVALFMYCMDRGPFYRDETREQSGYTAAQKAASDIWTSNQTTGRAMGSTSLNTEESDKVNQFYGDIKTYIEQSVLEFIIGNRDLSEFDAYVAHVEEMGIDQVTACYQDAYERYLNGEVVEEVSADPGPPPDDAPAP
jgi:putative aldouronate transport system substrate-binding protein